MSDRSPSRPAGSNHQERYVPAFDGVRAIAALMVFATHYLGWDAGTYGVNIFLVLSGLLITGVLLDASHHTHRFRNFYIRRSLRIFPLFYGVWLLLLLLTPWLHIEWNRRAVLYPLYLGNFIRLLVPDAASHAALLELVCVRPHLHAPSTRFLFVVSHLWSLCLEEQFYLVWPFVVYTVRSRRTLLRICCVSILLVPVVRVISLHLAPGDPLALWELTPLRFDEFLLGALGALLLRSSFRSRLLAAATPVFLVGAAILLVGFFVHRHLHGSAGTWTWRMTGDFAGVDLATFGLLLLGIRQESLVARALSLAPLRALGASPTASMSSTSFPSSSTCAWASAWPADFPLSASSSPAAVWRPSWLSSPLSCSPRSAFAISRHPFSASKTGLRPRRYPCAIFLRPE